jgi:hypothetical protein
MLSTAEGYSPDANSFAAQRSARPGKEFDLVAPPVRRRVEASHARSEDISVLLENAKVAMGVALAREDVVARIACDNPDSVWVFRRRGRIVGGFAMLMLNRVGLSALLANKCDFAEPPASLLAPYGTRPSAIYVWAVLGASVASEGIAQVIARVQQCPYELSDVFATPATEDGLRFMQGLCFRPVPGHPRSLHQYVRLVNRAPPSGHG